MSRERVLEAFIIKKQDYGEADQIITLFSREEGKIRALVKAAKLPTSKLQPMLQQIFLSRVTLAGGNAGSTLPKVIGAQLITAYSGILEAEAKVAAWYVASELVLRSLADSASNEPLFFELQQFGEFLHSKELTAAEINLSVIQFQIKAMNTLGLGVRNVPVGTSNIKFSLDRGGFTPEDAADSIPVTANSYAAFQNLAQSSYGQTGPVEQADYKTLSGLISRFVTYQLEREIKSQRLFKI